MRAISTLCPTLVCMEHDFFISLQELKKTAHLSGCAQHFHRGTWNGVKLCHWRWLDAVTRAEEGPLSYSVVVGGWTSLGATTTTDQTLHPSILLTSNQGLNPENYTLWESEWQFFQRAGSAIAIFTRGRSKIGFFKEHGSLVENPDGACRSVPQFCLAWAAVWSDAVQILWFRYLFADMSRD